MVISLFAYEILTFLRYNNSRIGRKPVSSQCFRELSSMTSVRERKYEDNARRAQQWNPRTKILILAVIVLLLLAQGVSSCTSRDYDFRRPAVSVEPAAEVSALEFFPAGFSALIGRDVLVFLPVATDWPRTA